MNIMSEKVSALWVWIKKEANKNKFRKGFPEEMTVKLSTPKDEEEQEEKAEIQQREEHIWSGKKPWHILKI